MILVFSVAMLAVNAAQTTAVGINPAVPLGSYECKIAGGEFKGEQLSFENLVSGVSIARGGSFTRFTGPAKSEAVKRPFEGGVVEGIQFDVPGENGEVRFSLDKVSEKKSSLFRIWIMRQAGPPTSSGTGAYFTHTVAFAFSAFGSCEGPSKAAAG